MKTNIIWIALLLGGCGGADFESDLYETDGGAGSSGAAGAAGSDGGAGSSPDADAASCHVETIVDHCGACPDGTHPTSIYEPGTSGCEIWLRQCETDCDSFVMCSITAPCPDGWTETATTFSEPCTGGGNTKPNGDNAIVCER
jgi:hypothetical protein